MRLQSLMPEARIILMTAQATRELPERAMDLGALRSTINRSS
jgi:hypothetical protein